VVAGRGRLAILAVAASLITVSKRRFAMTFISLEKVIARPPRTVFDFVATHHFQNHPKWDPDVLEMTQTSPGPVATGTTARVVRRQGGSRVEGTATVTEYEPDRSAAWEVRFGQFVLDQRAELTPEEEEAATRLRLAIRTRASGPMRLLVPLLRGRFRRTMEHSLATIADLLE
jgi:Polyketide cyclase / dehydrase and lipid transport